MSQTARSSDDSRELSADSNSVRVYLQSCASTKTDAVLEFVLVLKDPTQRNCDLSWHDPELTIKDIINISKPLNIGAHISKLDVSHNKLSEKTLTTLLGFQKERSVTDLTSLYLDGNSITSNGVRQIITLLDPRIKNIAVKTLSLDGNLIDDEGIKNLASFLSSLPEKCQLRPHLLSLSLSNNQIGNDGCQALSSLLTSSATSLLHMNISHNHLILPATLSALLTTVLSSTIHSFSASGITLTENDLVGPSHFISTDLTSLSLSFDSNSTVELFISTLTANTTLTTLHLGLMEDVPSDSCSHCGKWQQLREDWKGSKPPHSPSRTTSPSKHTISPRPISSSPFTRTYTLSPNKQTPTNTRSSYLSTPRVSSGSSVRPHTDDGHSHHLLHSERKVAASLQTRIEGLVRLNAFIFEMSPPALEDPEVAFFSNGLELIRDFDWTEADGPKEWALTDFERGREVITNETKRRDPLSQNSTITQMLQTMISRDDPDSSFEMTFMNERQKKEAIEKRMRGKMEVLLSTLLQKIDTIANSHPPIPSQLSPGSPTEDTNEIVLNALRQQEVQMQKIQSAVHESLVLFTDPSSSPDLHTTLAQIMNEYIPSLQDALHTSISNTLHSSLSAEIGTLMKEQTDEMNGQVEAKISQVLETVAPTLEEKLCLLIERKLGEADEVLQQYVSEPLLATTSTASRANRTAPFSSPIMSPISAHAAPLSAEDKEAIRKELSGSMQKDIESVVSGLFSDMFAGPSKKTRHSPTRRQTRQSEDPSSIMEAAVRTLIDSTAKEKFAELEEQGKQAEEQVDRKIQEIEDQCSEIMNHVASHQTAIEAEKDNLRHEIEKMELRLAEALGGEIVESDEEDRVEVADESEVAVRDESDRASVDSEMSDIPVAQPLSSVPKPTESHRHAQRMSLSTDEEGDTHPQQTQTRLVSDPSSTTIRSHPSQSSINERKPPTQQEKPAEMVKSRTQTSVKAGKFKTVTEQLNELRSMFTDKLSDAEEETRIRRSSEEKRLGLMEESVGVLKDVLAKIDERMEDLERSEQERKDEGQPEDQAAVQEASARAERENERRRQNEWFNERVREHEQFCAELQQSREEFQRVTEEIRQRALEEEKRREDERLAKAEAKLQKKGKVDLETIAENLKQSTQQTVKILSQKMTKDSQALTQTVKTLDKKVRELDQTIKTDLEATVMATMRVMKAAKKPRKT
ncbi:hypothetical protein BLNAU_15035 [Blattamonas nauphoetae]|uniref:Uncharacterized protein n=1 Tax=Blattamonas nauphoetae TaxID=2049346 RepID=A0ABQ9XF24_9EUKA|nr:hypothetical protein BLNAU_15035 [Blattamonas nauphoetae]